MTNISHMTEFMAQPDASNSPLRDPPPDYCPENSGHWFTVPEGKNAGRKIFYYDIDCSVDGSEPEATIVFVHGNPECSYTYRHARDAAIASGKNIRIVAMDHIGFGLSDQADFEMVEMHHADNLRQLVSHLDLNNVTLVIHDWGGPIGVGGFNAEPHRVSNLLIANTTIFPMPDDGYRYTNYPARWLPWAITPKLVPSFLWGGVAAYVVSHGKPQNMVMFTLRLLGSLIKHGLRLFSKKLPDYVWSQMLRSRANARSSKRFVRQTPFWGHGYHYDDKRHGMQDNHSFYKKIQKDIVDVWGPDAQDIGATAFFGRWDPCGKSSVEAQWVKALPQLKGHIHNYDDMGHFIEEYKGPEMAHAILEMNGLS